MRAVAVVGSKGKVGSRRWLLWNGHAALVIGSTREGEAEVCMVWGRGTADGVRRRRAPVGSARGPVWLSEAAAAAQVHRKWNGNRCCRIGGVLLGRRPRDLKRQNHLTSRKLEAQGSTLAYAGADSESRNPVQKQSSAVDSGR